MELILCVYVLASIGLYLVFRLASQAKNLTLADVVLYLALVGMTAYVYMNYDKLGIEIWEQDFMIIVNCFFLATAIWSFFDGAFTFLLVRFLLPAVVAVENPTKIGIICGIVVMVFWWAATYIKDKTLRTICRGFYWTFSVILSLFSAFAYAYAVTYKDGVITYPVLAAGIFIVFLGALLATRKASLYTRKDMNEITITV